MSNNFPPFNSPITYCQYFLSPHRLLNDAFICNVYIYGNIQDTKDKNTQTRVHVNKLRFLLLIFRRQ